VYHLGQKALYKYSSFHFLLLAVLRFWLNTYDRRTFSVAGPTVWNSLPDFIRDLASVQAVLDAFVRSSASIILGVLYKFSSYLLIDLLTITDWRTPTYGIQLTFSYSRHSLNLRVAEAFVSSVAAARESCY